MRKYLGLLSILIVAVTAYICFFIAKDLHEAVGYSVIFITYFVAGIAFWFSPEGWRRKNAPLIFIGLTVVYIGILTLFTMSQR